MSKIKTTPTRYTGVYAVDGRPGTYRLWGQVPNPKTGKKQTVDKIVSGLASAKEAHDKRTELLAAIEIQQPKVERKTFRVYATSWLRSKMPELKASTRSLYATVLDEHALPVLGDYYLDAITRDDLLDWREAQCAKPKVDAQKRPRFDSAGDPLLPEIVTVNGRFRVLKEVMRDAVVSEKLPIDPTQRIGPLREHFVDDDERAVEESAKSITADELRRLLDTARAHAPRWYPFFFVLAFTGLRFGEISALKWRDVDEDAGKIWIRRSQWQGKVDTVKNSKPRTVPLMSELLEVLNAHREAQQAAFILRAKRRALPDISALVEGDWIFPSRRSFGEAAESSEALKLMHNTAPRKALIKVTAKAGIAPGFTIHGFRHTFNNLVRNVAELNGQNIVLQAMTGHSSDEMTEHYSQVSIEEKRRAVGGLLRLVHTSHG